MPSKKYVPAPLEAYAFKAGDDAQVKELEKAGIVVSHDAPSDAYSVSGPGGNTLSINDGDYIAVDTYDNVRVYGKEFFEKNYVAK